MLKIQVRNVVVTRQQSTEDAIAATGCIVVCKNM